MSYTLYTLFAFIAGGLLAAQAGLNSRLALLVQDTFLASTAAFLTAFLCVGSIYTISSTATPEWKLLLSVPPYLWVAGGLFSALAVSGIFFLIPKMGISSVIVCGLAGQLVTSLVAAHFGWFDLPRSPVDTTKLAGAAALLIGAFLVTYA